MLLAGRGLERDLKGREARQTTRGPDPRSVVDAELIAEVDPKREVLGRLSRARPATHGAAWCLAPRNMESALR